MIRAQNPDDLGNGQTGHAEIRDHDVGNLSSRGEQRRIAVRNRRHPITGFLQNFRNEKANAFAIVDEEDIHRTFGHLVEVSDTGGRGSS